LLYISTAGFFKAKQDGQIADEHDLPTSLAMMNHYTQSKFIAQESVFNELISSNLPAIILNPSFMIGQRDAKPSSGQLLFFYLKNKWLFCPKGGKNFVDVEDVAHATVNAITQGQIGESYILGNQNLSYQAFFEKVDQVIGISKPKFLIPNAILTTTGRVGSAYNKLFNKNLQFDYQNSKVLTQNYFYDASKAVSRLAMPQTSIEQAIEKAIRWFVENKYLNLKIR
jgi:dihydroflavonol-4-reductase